MKFLFVLLIMIVLLPFVTMPHVLSSVCLLLFLLPVLSQKNAAYNFKKLSRQLLNISMKRSVRRNHALEHATLNILEEWTEKKLELSGLAFKNGFSLSGRLPSPELVFQAADEALLRIKQGDLPLVIHRECVISHLISRLFISTLIFSFLLVAGHSGIESFVISLFMASIFSKPLTRLVQLSLTTSTDIKKIEIRGIAMNPHGKGFFVITENRKGNTTVKNPFYC